MPQSRSTAQLKQVNQPISADFILSKSSLSKASPSKPGLSKAGLAEKLGAANAQLLSPVGSMAEQLADLYRARQTELAEKETLTIHGQTVVHSEICLARSIACFLVVLLLG